MSSENKKTNEYVIQTFTQRLDVKTFANRTDNASFTFGKRLQNQNLIKTCPKPQSLVVFSEKKTY